jgi:putative flippase GtrA
MKTQDIIFAAATGLTVAFIGADFLNGVNLKNYSWHLFWLFPLLSVICLKISEIIGKKAAFIHQAAKFFLVGAFSAVVDIKIYQFSAWMFGLFFLISPITSKSISFLAATVVKYGGNKIWVFEKNGKDGIKKEIVQFFTITLIGMIIDVATFYYFTKIMGPQFSMQSKIWEELSIIFAALVAALWNFLGYKFWVFAKPKTVPDN